MIRRWTPDATANSFLLELPLSAILVVDQSTNFSNALRHVICKCVGDNAESHKRAYFITVCWNLTVKRVLNDKFVWDWKHSPWTTWSIKSQLVLRKSRASKLSGDKLVRLLLQMLLACENTRSYGAHVTVNPCGQVLSRRKKSLILTPPGKCIGILLLLTLGSKHCQLPLVVTDWKSVFWRRYCCS